MRYRASLVVNGEPVEAYVSPTTTLLELLRDHLDLTGAKRGCDVGECGACTVLLDGEAVCSCLVLALSASGKQVCTIEGLAAPGGRLHPVQAAFVEHHGLQCGACTPGMVMSAVALLAENPSPSPEQIRHAIGGNLCRCTGYQKIIESIAAAAASMRQEEAKA